MKKVFVFLALALVIAIGFAAHNTTAGFSAPKDGNVRVWVEFEPGRKGATQVALKNADAQFHYTFDELNSFVVTLPAAALQGISRNPNVVSIEEDVPRYFIAPEPMTVDEPGDPYTEEVVPYGVDAVQARDVWDVDRNDVIDSGAPTGAGIKVCIIDTGFLAEHEDLDGSKVEGGISQVDNDYLYDGYGHGSHVAGTISAMLNDMGVVGVTPGTVSFHIVKIFGNDGAWVSGASDLVAAIYSCRDNGADIINMSLGGGSSSRKEEKAFDSIYAGGILSIAAAGNDNVSDPNYPASYSSVVSVSAVDKYNAKADFSNFGDDVELAAPGVAIWSTIPYIETTSLAVNGEVYDSNHIEYAAFGSVSGALVDGGLCGSTNSAWSGYVVLCERGDYSFAEKILNVENSGGLGAVIYNNEPGNFLGTMGEDSSSIVGLSISQEDGQYLVANELSSTADLNAYHEQPASGYEAWGGTSMASPHVAGVAALIWSSDPTLTNTEVREAMVETALDLGDVGWDEYFGYGLVQAADAIDYLGGGPVNQAPSVSISSPGDGATFDSGVTISFSGSANDLEDGDLGGSLIWTSSIDEEIGTGASFSAVLSDGTHTITAFVVDSGGIMGSASVNITVGTAQANMMGVSDIFMSSSQRGVNYTITTIVVIKDQNSALVSGATVDVNINGVLGSGVTGSDGRVTFSLSTRNPADSYTSTVTNVEHDNYTWDGVEASVTLPMP